MKELIIDKAKIIHNINIIKQYTTGTDIFGVIKSNAYGMGLIETARVLSENGIRKFAVSDPNDAKLLRENGFIDMDILIMRSTTNDQEIEMIIQSNAIATIGSQQAAIALAGIAARKKQVVEAHIKIDTGFGRYGFLPTETNVMASVYQYMENIAICGIYTHIASDAGKKAVQEQIMSLKYVVSSLNSKGLETGISHALSSSVLLKHKDIERLDAVRIGQALTGRVSKQGFKKVGMISADITEVRWISKSLIGKKKVNRKVGIISVGYYDGYAVERPNNKVKLFSIQDKQSSYGKIRLENGEKLKIIGKIGQNHTVVDLTNVEASVGSLVYMEANPLFVTHMQRKYI